MSTSTVKVKAGFLPQSKGQEEELQDEEVCKRNAQEDVNIERESEGLRCSNVHKDVLLQWGQRKRQRNGRLETKAPAVEELFALPKEPSKVERRVAVADKHARCLQTQLPHANKAHALRPCTPFKRISFGNEQRKVEAFALASILEHGSKKSRPEDPKRNLTAPVIKAESRENAQQQDERETAIMCNGSASGGFLASHAVGGADLGAGYGRPSGLENVDLESMKWPKFVVALSRKEKEDDFLAIKGSKLPQRPKKRSKHIEKALHYISPGMWLSDLTRERYEVREKAVKRRPRGLKAMGSNDTDSE